LARKELPAGPFGEAGSLLPICFTFPDELQLLIVLANALTTPGDAVSKRQL
jgi:hypothetical protein